MATNYFFCHCHWSSESFSATATTVPLGCPVALLRRVTLRHAEPQRSTRLGALHARRWAMASWSSVRVRGPRRRGSSSVPRPTRENAGSGDSSDEARFRHFAAASLMMTNQIGVARTILANLPITRHSQDRGRPLLGYVPLALDCAKIRRW